jgi:hypothetical protein
VNPRIRHRRVLQFEPLEDRLTLTSPPGSLAAVALHLPAEQGRGLSRVQELQAQGQGSQRRLLAARRRLELAFRGFHGALANLNRSLDRIENAGSVSSDATLRGFNRAVSRTLRAEDQLNRAFVSSPTVLQEANRLRQQQALGDLARADARVEEVLEQTMGQPPDSSQVAEAHGGGN